MTSNSPAQFGIALAGVMAAALICAGCSPQATVFPATGSILVNGQPADGAYVVFTLLGGDGKRRETARTEKDGTYLVRLRNAGQYAVTVFWPKTTHVADETIEGEDRFGGRFQRIEQPVLTTTIQGGDNVVPPVRLKHP